jgi:hypothetical protein
MNHEPSQDTLMALESLRNAVAKALERKRRLNQYAVIWQDGKPVILGKLPEQTTQVQEDASKYGKQED